MWFHKGDSMNSMRNNLLVFVAVFMFGLLSPLYGRGDELNLRAMNASPKEVS